MGEEERRRGEPRRVYREHEQEVFLEGGVRLLEEDEEAVVGVEV